MTAPHLGPGHSVAGRYTVRALLGFTGEQATYHATAAGGQEVVVKLFDPALGQRADVMSRLERVRAQVASLPAASVVAVFDSGYDVGTSAPFSVSEYLHIPSLARLADTGPLSPEVVGKIMIGVAQILDAAHAIGLYHLALKPTNIFVGPAPHYQVRITDFGASVVRSTSPTHEAYAQSAPWWAPEQLQPAAVLGTATDVFSAALVAFYALTGRPYWMSCQRQPPDLPAWQMEVMGARTPVSQRARELGAVVNPIIDGVFARALSLNQPERPQTVIELANALTSASGYGARDAPKTMALPELGAPPAQGGYAPAPPGQYSPAPFGGGVAPATDGHYTATAGTRPQARSNQNMTPGLPPFPQPTKKKKDSATLPVIIGVSAAVLLGGGGVALLFMRGDDAETGPTSVAAGSSKPNLPDDEDQDEGDGDTPTSATSAATTAEPGAGGGDGGSGDVKKVAVSITCEPACDELWIDGEKLSDPTAKLELIPGRHTVKALKEGYYPKLTTITVEADKPFEEKYVLARVVATPKPKNDDCGQFIRPCK